MGGRLRVAPLQLSDSLQARLRRLYGQAKYLPNGQGLLVPIPTELLAQDDAEPLVDWVRKLLVALEIIEREPAAEQS